VEGYQVLSLFSFFIIAGEETGEAACSLDSIQATFQLKEHMIRSRRNL